MHVEWEELGTWSTVVMGTAITMSSAFNGWRFWLLLEGTARPGPGRRAERVRQLAASALLLLNVGIGLQAMHVTAIAMAEATGLDTVRFLATAALVQAPALAGSLLTAALLLRDTRTGGTR